MKNKKSFAKTLLKQGKHVYSQTIEDGIIEGIFKNIGTTNKYFVEFGAWDGVFLSNTANLRLNEGWKGLLLEGNVAKAAQYEHITHAFLTAENINDVFQKNNVPKEFDLLSIDIDGNDYWIWKAIDESRFSPRVVIVEYNCNFEDQNRSVAIKYSPEMDSCQPSIYYHSATIPALKKLGESKGYSLIFRVNMHNLFFVKTELLHEDDINIPLEMFLNKDGKAPWWEDCGEPVYGVTGALIPPPHWNEYADTQIEIFWQQDFTKEWIEV